MYRRIKYIKGRIAENPIGQHVVAPGSDRIWEVTDYRYQWHGSAGFYLYCRTFNREHVAWFNAGAVKVLDRSYTLSDGAK